VAPVPVLKAREVIALLLRWVSRKCASADRTSGSVTKTAVPRLCRCIRAAICHPFCFAASPGTSDWPCRNLSAAAG